MSYRLRTFVVLALVLLPVCVLAQDADMEHTYAAAQRALAAGDRDGALKLLEQLSHTNPKVAELHATIGAIRFQQGDFTGALQQLTEAKRLNPALPKLDGLIAMSQSELGHFKEAVPGLEATFRTTTDKPVKRMSGLQLERAYTAVHRDSDAVSVALELQRLFPNDAEVLYHNERIFGNFAYLTVMQLADVAPDSVWRRRAQAEANESQGLHDAAIAAYREVLASDPNRRGIHYRIGRCYRERARETHHPEDLVSAMNEFQAELKIDAGNANAAYEIGELHRLAGELEPARTYFELAVQMYPDFPEANLGLGTVLASMGRPAEALPHLKVAIANDPGDGASWYRLSQVERSLGHTAEQQAALKEFKRIHDKESDSKFQPARDVSRQEVSPDSP